MSWSCDYGFQYLYAERIAQSDGAVWCSETGIVIPEGFPYADCRLACLQDTPADLWPYMDEDGYLEDVPIHITLDRAEVFPQAIEVWRLLRNDSKKRGACPTFTMAIEEYADHADDSDVDRLAYVRLLRTVRRVKRRYTAQRPPRLHPHEQDSLATGQFSTALPFSIRAKEEPA